MRSGSCSPALSAALPATRTSWRPCALRGGGMSHRWRASVRDGWVVPEATGAAVARRLRPSYIGARLPRLEDERLLAGRGRYLADIDVPGCVELALVRSPFAHARISGIDLTAAVASEGVLMAVTAADLDGVAPVPDFFEWAQPVRTFPLCRDRVRYVGAPVAAVVAEDRYLAEDAVELVQVEYE